MKYELLGENIQRVRKFRGMNQQELADAIGINMQSLSKIERGVNFPTFDTLEKITSVLEHGAFFVQALMCRRAV